MIPENKTRGYWISNKREYTELFCCGNCLSSESPSDNKSQEFAVEKCEGRILIGGLGTGWIVSQLAKKDSVTEITVIEKAKEVKDLVWPYINTDKCDIIITDIFEYLELCRADFDWIYLDIWGNPNKELYRNVVLPLRELAERIVKSERVLCWQEDFMRSL